MKCTNCGFESELNYPVCPQCQAQANPNPAAQKVLDALKDPLFLIICILMSISCLLSLSAGSVPLIEILITVFLWLVYAQSRKEIADAKHLRCVSGAVYANYVITYVTAGLVVILGVLFTVAFGIIAGDPSFLETLLSGVASVDYATVAQVLAFIPAGLILFVFILIAAIIIVINIFSLRYIHRFAKSVYQSIETGVLELKHTAATKVWLFIIGGFSAVSCLSADGQLSSLVSNAASAAICIISGLLIHKYLSDDSIAPAVPQEDDL